MALALIAGGLLMGCGPERNTMNANAATPAAPSAPILFALKPADHYFAHAQALQLLRAALAGDVVAARAALAAGAAPDEEGPLGNADNRLRLLHYAVAAQRPDAARLLVELGADPELNTLGFGPALVFAITLDQPDPLGAMLEARPFSRLTPASQKTLLFAAVRAGRQRCLAVLLERGAPIDLRDEAGYTPLMRAINALDMPMAQALLARGASLQPEAVNGATAPNQVQALMLRAAAGSPMSAGLAQLKTAMQARGVTFPVPTAQEVRASRQPR